MSQPRKITDRIKKAWIDPELDKVEKGARKALERMQEKPGNGNIAANLLPQAYRDLDREFEELEELGIQIPASEREKFKKVYERRFKIFTADDRKEAILESPEKMDIEGFLEDYVKYTGLDEIIEAAQEKQAKDPLQRFVSLIRASTPLLSTLGTSLTEFLEKETDAEKDNPSRLKTAAAKADEAIQEEKEDEEEEKEEEEKEEEEGKKGGKGKKSAQKPGKTADHQKASPAVNTKDTEVESAGTKNYEFNPENVERLSPEDFRKKYLSIEDQKGRNLFVLEQVAAGNTTNAFEQLKITGRSGKMSVQMEVDRSGLRVADMDVQLDGPTAMAAAEIAGCTLPTPWISEQIYRQAKKEGGTIPFITYDAIAKALGYSDEEAYVTKKNGERAPNGRLMMSPEFAVKRDELLRKYRKNHGIEAGYFKDVVHPIPGATGKGRLEIYGGKTGDGKIIQPVSEGHHVSTYADYSHGVRRVRRTVTVTEEGKSPKTMDISEFYNNPQYADEFGFQAQELKDPAYPYTRALQDIVNAAKKSWEKLTGGDKKKTEEPKA